jgi:dTMP kinase
MLVAALTRAGIAAQRTREPGGSEGAEAIRRLLLEGADERWDAIAETLLFYAARREHVTRLITPALDRGTWVVCDRFADSTIAYQGYGRGLPLAELQALHSFALGDFAPDVTLILDLPVAEGLTRAARRSGNTDRFERLDHAFHERLRQGFHQIAAADPQRCVVIDASGDVETVHRAVLGAVVERLGVALSA